jgi:hypothetical protein
MEKSELLAVAKLLGYSVSAKRNEYNLSYWITIVHGVYGKERYVIHGSNASKKIAIAYGWEWICSYIKKSPEEYEEWKKANY